MPCRGGHCPADVGVASLRATLPCRPGEREAQCALPGLLLRRSVSQRSAFLASRSTQRTLQVREGYVPPTLGGPGAWGPSSTTWLPVERQAAGSSVSLSPCTFLHAVAYGRAGAIPLPVGTRDGSLWDVGGGTPSRCRAAHLILVGLALSPSGVAPSIRATGRRLGCLGPFPRRRFALRPHLFWVTSVGRAPQSPGRRGRAGRRHLAQPIFPRLRSLCAPCARGALSWPSVGTSSSSVATAFRLTGARAGPLSHRCATRTAACVALRALRV